MPVQNVLRHREGIKLLQRGHGWADGVNLQFVVGATRRTQVTLWMKIDTVGGCAAAQLKSVVRKAYVPLAEIAISPTTNQRDSVRRPGKVGGIARVPIREAHDRSATADVPSRELDGAGEAQGWD